MVAGRSSRRSGRRRPPAVPPRAGARVLVEEPDPAQEPDAGTVEGNEDPGAPCSDHGNRCQTAGARRAHPWSRPARAAQLLRVPRGRLHGRDAHDPRHHPPGRGGRESALGRDIHRPRPHRARQFGRETRRHVRGGGRQRQPARGRARRKTVLRAPNARQDRALLRARGPCAARELRRDSDPQRVGSVRREIVPSSGKIAVSGWCRR